MIPIGIESQGFGAGGEEGGVGRVVEGVEGFAGGEEGERERLDLAAGSGVDD